MRRNILREMTACLQKLIDVCCRGNLLSNLLTWNLFYIFAELCILLIGSFIFREMTMMNIRWFLIIVFFFHHNPFFNDFLLVTNLKKGTKKIDYIITYILICLSIIDLLLHIYLRLSLIILTTSLALSMCIIYWQTGFLFVF